MQKKGTNRGRSLLTSSPFLLMVIAGMSILSFWYYSREPNLREISQGSLMSISKAEDPTAHFQKLLIRKGSDIRGDLVVNDVISDGSLKAKQPEERIPFRTRIGLPLDQELLTRLDKIAGPHYQVDDERTFQESMQTMLFLAVMILPCLFFVVMLTRWMAGGGGALTFGRSKHKLYAQKDLKITFRGRRRHRRGGGRIARDRRFPQDAGEVSGARRADSQGRAAGRPARHRQDAAGQGGRRRGGRAVLLA